MKLMIIPHEDPNSPELDSPLPVAFEREARLTWSDFHPETGGPDPLHSQRHHTSAEPQWRRVANELNYLRTLFTRQNTQGVHARCSNVDRSSVLAVYNEALVKLEHAANIDAIKIHLEAKTKVSTILDIRQAAPHDAVFYKQGAFLDPLEPHYAHPRLNYYNRGTDDGDDSFYWNGVRRLNEWRKGGWPDIYPEKAVEQEKEEREDRRRRGRVASSDVHKENLLMALEADPSDWGEVIDADPGRPWR